MVKPKLRWKKEKLSTVGAVGVRYHDGNKIYARVYKIGGYQKHQSHGWYWVAGWGSGIPFKNTCDFPCETIEDAKTQASEYVKNNLTPKIGDK